MDLVPASIYWVILLTNPEIGAVEGGTGMSPPIVAWVYSSICPIDGTFQIPLANSKTSHVAQGFDTDFDTLRYSILLNPSDSILVSSARLPNSQLRKLGYSQFANSIIPVPQGTHSNAQRYYRIDIWDVSFSMGTKVTLYDRHSENPPNPLFKGGLGILTLYAFPLHIMQPIGNHGFSPP
jgi:hypothetical protein